MGRETLTWSNWVKLNQLFQESQKWAGGVALLGRALASNVQGLGLIPRATKKIKKRKSKVNFAEGMVQV